jgi:hypothetical protein
MSVVLRSTGENGVVKVCLPDAYGDRTLRAWEDSAKHAIRRQMSGDRPGCLFIRLEGMSHEAMKSVSAAQPNVLSVFATKILSNDRHKHVAAIVFVSDSEWLETPGKPQLGQSCTYVFNNPGGSFPNFGIGSYFME